MVTFRKPKLHLKRIDWVIVGRESGHGARPMKAEWARSIRDRCVEQGVPFFFKQWGGLHKSKNGRTLDGRTWDEMPVHKMPKSNLALQGSLFGGDGFG